MERIFKSEPNVYAFDDHDFLRSDACRGVRLQIEEMRPELELLHQRVTSTVSIFGSARLRSREEAQAALDKARAALAEAPNDPARKAAVRRAESLLKNSKYYDMAREFAGVVSEYDKDPSDGYQFVVVTGGGPGIMEAGNRGAHDHGALSIGLSMNLANEQKSNPYITPELNFKFHYFAIRKMHFMKRAVALAAFPGGFGTMDELFEALTLIQTETVPRIPILLFGSDFWKGLINWEKFVDDGVISPEDLELFRFCDSAEEGWNEIKRFYGDKMPYYGGAKIGQDA